MLCTNLHYYFVLLIFYPYLYIPLFSMIPKSHTNCFTSTMFILFLHFFSLNNILYVWRGFVDICELTRSYPLKAVLEIPLKVVGIISCYSFVLEPLVILWYWMLMVYLYSHNQFWVLLTVLDPPTYMGSPRYEVPTRPHTVWYRIPIWYDDLISIILKNMP